MEIRIIIILFILGMLFGSFGSVLITRLSGPFLRKDLRSVLIGRSHCPACHRQLHAVHLVPLVSFLRQRGRCAFCSRPISRMYPIVELLSGAVFVGTFLLLPGAGIGLLVFMIALNRLLLLLLVADLQTYSVPLPIWGIALLLSLSMQAAGVAGNIYTALAFAAVFAAIFLLLYWGSRRYVKQRYHVAHEGLGQGDIYIAALLGSLMPVVLKYQQFAADLHADLRVAIYLFLMFIIISCLIGLLLAGTNALLPDKNVHLPHLTTKINASHILPFVPAMILSFWILLLRGSFFIGLCLG